LAFSPPISKIVRTSGCVTVMALTRQRKSFSYVAPMSGASLTAAPPGDRDRPHLLLAEDLEPPGAAVSGTFRTGSPRRRSYERLYPFPAPGNGTPSGSRNVPRRSAGSSVEPSEQKQGKLHADRADVDSKEQVVSPPSGNMGLTRTSHTMVVPVRRSLTNQRVTNPRARHRAPGSARTDNRLSDRTLRDIPGPSLEFGARRGIVIR